MRFRIPLHGAVVTALFAVCVSIAAGMVPLSGQRGAPASPASYVPNEILITYRAETSLARRDAALASVGASVVRRFDGIGVRHVRLRPGMSVEAAMTIAQADPDVLAAQPNYIRHSTAPAPPNDPYWLADNMWGLLKIQAPSVWSTFTTGGTSVIVADIDSGVNYGHPDLAANMWRNPGEIAGNGVDDDRNGYVDDVYGIDTRNGDADPMDDNGHGTHTAGTIGGVGNNGVGVVGVNWNARILACKFLGPTGNGSDAGAIECFNYITALKNRGVNIRISSNSWGAQRGPGAPFPTALRAAIDAAGAAGILNVFAAGNDGANDDVTPFDPASFTSTSIVAVAASSNSDAPATFSSYGATSVDLAAPGVGIWSTYGNGYAPLNGTSMATPHVAGAAALLLAQRPDLTGASLKSLLLANVDPLPQWTGLVASGGRLNVYKAMLAGSPNIAPTVSLLAPDDGASFVAPASVAVAATASDSDGSIVRVDFLVNGSVAASDATAPYSATLSGLSAGTYAVAATAIDNIGASATSPARTVTVVPPSVGSAASVSFVTTDTTTQGTWRGSLGRDGYVVVGDTASLPVSAQVSASGQSTWTWYSSTGDPRALQRAGGDRVMAAWYGNAFSLDVDITGATPQQVAIYVADYDAGGRQQQFDLIDVATGALLDRRVASSFNGGQYLVWTILGHVRIEVSRLAGPNAVVSGVLIGPGGAPVTPGGESTASFVGEDEVTQGSWQGVYGSGGYVVVGDATAQPAFGQISGSGQASWTWADSTTDWRALQRVGGSERLAATWYAGRFTIDVRLTDNLPHQLDLYAVDYDSQLRAQRFDLFDAVTGALLDSRTISAFDAGKHLLWNVRGTIRVVVTSLAGPNAVVSGMFLR